MGRPLDTVLAEIESLAADITSTSTRLEELYDRRRVLFVEAKDTAEPGATYDRIAVASGVSLPMVVKTLRAVRAAEAASG